MEANELMVPVYINEKIVLDMLAIIEDGFSMVSQVNYTECKENHNSLNCKMKLELRNWDKGACPFIPIRAAAGPLF